MLAEVDDVWLDGAGAPGESIVPVMLVVGLGSGAGAPGESIIPANAGTARTAVTIATAHVRRNLLTIL